MNKQRILKNRLNEWERKCHEYYNPFEPENPLKKLRSIIYYTFCPFIDFYSIKDFYVKKDNFSLIITIYFNNNKKFSRIFDTYLLSQTSAFSLIDIIRNTIKQDFLGKQRMGIYHE